LSEPFFHQTVQRLRAKLQDTDIEQSNFEFVLTFADRVESTQPYGFIFHVSRCGSTLIANAFRTYQSIALISEAQPITTLFRPYDAGLWPYPLGATPRCPRPVNDQSIRTAPNWQRGTSGREVHELEHPFLVAGPLALADCPCLVVIRDPLEVMLSNLSSPSGWMVRKSMLSFCRAAADLEKLTGEEY
jgi:hypothetical protein